MVNKKEHSICVLFPNLAATFLFSLHSCRILPGCRLRESPDGRGSLKTVYYFGWLYLPPELPRASPPEWQYPYSCGSAHREWFLSPPRRLFENPFHAATRENQRPFDRPLDTHLPAQKLPATVAFLPLAPALLSQIH